MRVDCNEARQCHSDCTRRDCHLERKQRDREGHSSAIDVPTFERETVRETKTGVFSFRLTGRIDCTGLMLSFQIGHFTAEQGHQTTKYKRLGK